MIKGCISVRCAPKLIAAAPFALLHGERLRYLRQMVSHGPDALWALVRFDPAAYEPFWRAMAWLYARVPSIDGLGEPSANWDAWAAFMRGRPKFFKALVRRALRLDGLQQRCPAALSGLRRRLQGLNGLDLRDEPESLLSEAHEACPKDRIAFESRVAWSTHAMRVHGYRTAAAKVAEGRTCLSCGKVYATPNRLRNHLKAVPECCRLWGRFFLEGSEPEVHKQCPPLQRLGFIKSCQPERPEPVCADLRQALKALEAKDCTTDFEIYDTVISFMAPLPTLRAEVLRWKASLHPESALFDAAENVSLILTP